MRQDGLNEADNSIFFPVRVYNLLALLAGGRGLYPQTSPRPMVVSNTCNLYYISSDFKFFISFNRYGKNNREKSIENVVVVLSFVL